MIGIQQQTLFVACAEIVTICCADLADALKLIQQS